MNLSEVLNGVRVTKMFQTMFGRMVTTHDAKVASIHYDSRAVQRGSMFIALRGVASDGHKFIGDAIANGATVVVLEDDTVLPDSFFMHAGVIKIVVGDTRKAMAQMTANYYGHPADKLKVIGVTGTNGKTTTTYLIKQLLEKNSNIKVGMIGTVEYVIGEEKFPATHTTPESLELHQLFAKMVEKNCSHVVMEVSSHSLHQHRVYGINFAAAVFTNLTQDHLDYHKTMPEYFKAKKILFDGLQADAVAVVNADSEYGNKIVADCKAKTVTYGITARADVQANDVELSVNGFSIGVAEKNFQSALVGKFNVYNFLAAYTTVMALDSTLKIGASIIDIEQLQPAPGRFEQIQSPKGWTAIIDYAHTPDALENCLQTIHDVLPKERTNTIITIFGCGGDRDTTKRPLMGKIAETLSDVVIVTSDNPRTEDAQKIIDDVLAGMLRIKKIIVEADRRLAIEQGIALARTGDVVLLAGKGHEEYQVIGKEKHHFSDKEIVQELIRAGK